jgi:hypothetical protein
LTLKVRLNVFCTKNIDMFTIFHSNVYKIWTGRLK